jgi:CrcB protein
VIRPSAGRPGLLAAIAIGGIAGAFGRHALGVWVTGHAATGFPWGTLLVNIAGSFLLCLLMRVLPDTTVSPETRAGLTTGFCGGFTTFSTFGFETAGLIRSGAYGHASLYVAATMLFGLAAGLLGFWAGALLVGRRRLAI